jgi:DNA-binding CsgD family transcriptional regulator/tetratricopeptide (TPR) repeat protein
VQTVRSVVCPVMVGRDDLLALVDRRLDELRDGSGHVLFVAGEAGIGKTRLLATIERRARAHGIRVARGGTYPSDVDVIGAALLELARSLEREAMLSDVGMRLRRRLEDAEREPGDPHRRRRSLVLDVADLLAETSTGGATMLALEDLHWADDLTLEVIAALSRRTEDRPIFVVATYRSDELYPRIPMRDWRARLVTQRRAEEIRLGRLSPAETGMMAALIVGSDAPVPSDVVEALQRRTDGIPLHVEELLGSLSDLGIPSTEAIEAAGAPDTIEDLIMARLDSRSDAAARVAAAGAVIGRSFDIDMLAPVMGVDPEALQAPLAELADHFILVPAQAPGRLGFRHALICDVIYASLPEIDRQRLHDRTAQAASARPDIGTAAFLSIHYERAGRSREAFVSAIAGAERATQLSSHGEARVLLERAIRTAPPDLDPGERAAVLRALGDSAAATDHNAEAAQAYEDAHAAFLRADRPVDAAAVIAPLVAVRHLLGDDLATRADRLRDALEALDAVSRTPPEPTAGTVIGPTPAGSGVDPRPTAAQVRAGLLAGLAAAYMLDRQLEAAIGYATQARDAAAAAGDELTERNAATTLGACLVFAGRMDDGWTLLDSVIADARAAQFEAEAARAYRMIGSSASVLVEYERAERWLREGIEYAERVEAWNHRHYMAAHLAHVLWATGRWDEAEGLARASLADGRGGLTTRITALHVLGFVALGRGRMEAAASALDEARALGDQMGELQRRSPAIWGQAEAALLAGDPSRAAILCEAGRAASAVVDDAAYLFPFVVTGTRAYLAAGDPTAATAWLEAVTTALEHRAIPGTMAAIDHARGLLELAAGSTRHARVALGAARDAWLASARRWEEAWSRLDLARALLRSQQRASGLREASVARDLGIRLGAVPLVDAVDALVASHRRVAEGDESWSPLTAREFEVARLVAAGLTNAQIADELGIASKTVSAHVEHILAKLGMGRRAEVAAWAVARPVLHSDDTSTTERSTVGTAIERARDGGSRAGPPT